MSCGRELKANLRFCDGCGADVPAVAASAVGVAAAPALGTQLKSEVRTRSLDAWQGITLLARSPVVGLSESFARFGEDRGLKVGVAYAIVYEVVLVLGLLILRSKVNDFFGGFLLAGGELTVAQLLKILFLGLVPFGGLVGAIALTRSVLHGKGTFAGDVYTAGAVSVPWGLLVLVAAVIGTANLEIVAILVLFALTYSILMLYAGCSQIAGVRETAAAPAVPVILLLCAWLTKIMTAALW